MPQRGEPVICGRRICVDCGHWRHITEFAYRKAGNHMWILRICESCKRAQQRGYYHADPETHKRRVWAWQKRNPDKVLGYRQTERGSAMHRQRNERYRNNPEVAATRREYNRQYKERQRRAAGVPERPLKSKLHREFLAARQAERNRRLTLIEPEPLIDHAPFVEWIEGRLPVYGSIEQLARICHVNPRQLRTLREGRYQKNKKWYPVKGVGLDFVDLCIVTEGSLELWEVYPELYEDKSPETVEDESVLKAA